MNMIKYLPAVIMALAISGPVHGGEAVSHTTAQAPAETTGGSLPPCLTEDIATLSWSSDMSRYMDANCPSEWRKKALRQLWRQMPPPPEPNPTDF